MNFSRSCRNVLSTTVLDWPGDHGDNDESGDGVDDWDCRLEAQARVDVVVVVVVVIRHLHLRDEGEEVGGEGTRAPFQDTTEEVSSGSTGT